jgi:hypothetical protein
VIGACQRGAKVAWVDDGETEGVAYGTARHVCRDQQGNFAHGDDEPEALFVRITTTRGHEVFESLTALAVAYGEGLFVLDYSEPEPVRS